MWVPNLIKLVSLIRRQRDSRVCSLSFSAVLPSATEERPCEDALKRRWSLNQRVLTGNWISWHLDLGLPAMRTVRKYLSIMSATQPLLFYYCISSRLMPHCLNYYTNNCEGQSHSVPVFFDYLIFSFYW